MKLKQFKLCDVFKGNKTRQPNTWNILAHLNNSQKLIFLIKELKSGEGPSFNFSFSFRLSVEISILLHHVSKGEFLLLWKSADLLDSVQRRISYNNVSLQKTLLRCCCSLKNSDGSILQCLTQASAELLWLIFWFHSAFVSFTLEWNVCVLL